ncbi:hypothetical protein VNO77_04469 [Canavalia gladiata]|uniref:Uncharacterized protein n=1 Tax=Canavalia gladiata TaxID=3824 RepID=A0AAN9RD80_CANGL
MLRERVWLTCGRVICSGLVTFDRSSSEQFPFLCLFSFSFSSTGFLPTPKSSRGRSFGEEEKDFPVLERKRKIFQWGLEVLEIGKGGTKRKGGRKKEKKKNLSDIEPGKPCGCKDTALEASWAEERPQN